MAALQRISAHVFLLSQRTTATSVIAGTTGTTGTTGIGATYTSALFASSLHGQHKYGCGQHQRSYASRAMGAPLTNQLSRHGNGCTSMLPLPHAACPPLPQSYRSFASSASIASTLSASERSDIVNLTFVTADGDRVPIKAKVGDTILDLAHANRVELEGACEGTLACSTCHVILPEKYYKMLPPPEDEENDMLDLAFGLTDTSRLGCQVFVKKELEGMEVVLPGDAFDARKPS